MEPTKSQLWARNLSRNLESSYDSSALIGHKVTSGESREHQILDILKILLPQRFSLEKNIVIINHEDGETIKFDGALIDEANWPKLFYDGNTKVAPIESVKVAFEVKSNLGMTEIKKIYTEATNITKASLRAPEDPSIVVGFAYKCVNVKLSYYDFVANFLKSDTYPPIIAILNVGIFCFVTKSGDIATIPNKSCVPIFIETKDDTLLAYLYFLTRYISDGSVTSIMRKYSKQFFTSMEYFAFEESFIAKMNVGHDSLRKYFEGKKEVNLMETYNIAKSAAGL